MCGDAPSGLSLGRDILWPVTQAPHSCSLPAAPLQVTALELPTSHLACPLSPRSLLWKKRYRSQKGIIVPALPRENKNPHSTGLPIRLRCAPYLGPSLLHSLFQPRDLGKFWSTDHQSQAETKCRWRWTKQKHPGSVHTEILETQGKYTPPREYRPTKRMGVRRNKGTLPGQYRDSAPGYKDEPDPRDARLQHTRKSAMFLGKGQWEQKARE